MLREDFQHVCTAYAFHLKIEDDQVAEWSERFGGAS